jgi:hypothetical protein
VCAACVDGSSRRDESSSGSQTIPSLGPLRVDGGHFVLPDGKPFAWRGITAFRLLEMESAGRGPDVDAYLAWASSEGLNVVRVLAMAKHLFELPPGRGLTHLDALLRRAAAHRMFVEVVALADTASYSIDPAIHVQRVVRICRQHANALIEIANEPYHPTQDARVHDLNYLRELLRLVPPEVPAASGAAEVPALADGTYVTAHFPRSSGANGWGHVRDLHEGRALLRAARKPVISDEPIGAGPRFEPGRRDDDPERFRAAALATRLIGLGATFHYEGGLQARKPEGREAECFRTWQEAWTLLPSSEPFTASDPGEPGGPVQAITGAPAVASFVAIRGATAWVLIAGTSGPAGVEWNPEWGAEQSYEWPRSRLLSASLRTVSGRKSPSPD